MIRTDVINGRLRNRPLKDYAGHRFGKLVAVRLLERSETNNHIWEFICDCGNIKAAKIKNVRDGRTTSCGCFAKEITTLRNKTHGLSRVHKREYAIWKGMRRRCGSVTSGCYKDYGERGISVCDRWSDFAAFYCDMGSAPSGHSIDRIDVNGDYSPDNCRWATSKAQANNKRTNVKISISGIEKTLQQWCDEAGIDRTKVSYRLSKGMAIDEALKLGDLRRK